MGAGWPLASPVPPLSSYVHLNLGFSDNQDSSALLREDRWGTARSAEAQWLCLGCCSFPTNPSGKAGCQDAVWRGRLNEGQASWWVGTQALLAAPAGSILGGGEASRGVCVCGLRGGWRKEQLGECPREGGLWGTGDTQEKGSLRADDGSHPEAHPGPRRLGVAPGCPEGQASGAASSCLGPAPRPGLSLLWPKFPTISPLRSCPAALFRASGHVKHFKCF